MKKYVTLSLIIAFITSCSGEKKANSGQTANVPEISVAKPIVKDILLTRDYPGYLGAEKKVELVGRINGTLEASNFVGGEKVKKGQVLYVIEPTLYQNSVIQAEAELKTAQAQLEYVRNNYSRMNEAIKSDAVSHIQLLQVEAQVAEAVAAVSNAEAALNTARTNLSYCYVRAPFDGRMDLGEYDLGTYINGAAQPIKLATIYKEDLMYAYFNIADNQWFQMRLSTHRHEGANKVMIKVGQENPIFFPGSLDYFSPNIDLSTGTLNVRAVIDNSQGRLKTGAYVSVTLPYGEQKQATLIPEASIATDQLGKYIYVVTDSNTVSYRHITIGQLVEDTLRQVTSGISPDEYYVTKALLKVREGMKINPNTGKATEADQSGRIAQQSHKKSN